MEALLASFGMVAIAQMGDKTQFATIAPGASYASLTIELRAGPKLNLQPRRAQPHSSR